MNLLQEAHTEPHGRFSSETLELVCVLGTRDARHLLCKERLK